MLFIIKSIKTLVFTILGVLLLNNNKYKKKKTENLFLNFFLTQIILGQKIIAIVIANRKNTHTLDRSALVRESGLEAHL